MPEANGKYTVDVAKFRDAVQSLATELLTIEATGDFNRANALLDELRQVDAGDGDGDRDLKDIPVDITPVFPAAGEK